MAYPNRLLQLNQKTLTWLMDHIVGDDVEDNFLDLTPDMIKELSALFKGKSRRLYRGHHTWNFEDAGFSEYPKLGEKFTFERNQPSSWTHDFQIAQSFARTDKFGYVLQAIITANDIIFDDTVLNPDERDYLVGVIRQIHGVSRSLREAEVLVKAGSYAAEIIDIYDQDAPEDEEENVYSSTVVTAGMLDFPRVKLPKEVWLYEEDQPLPRLQPKLRSKILSEARYRLSKFGAELIGAMLYGGAATYQYKEGADIDVSLYIDWDKFKGDEEILQEAFKNVAIPWGPYELHLFVKPSNQKEQIEVADATYNVLKDEWSLPPLVLPKDFDPEVFFKPLVELAEKKAQKIDMQMGALSREWSRLKKLYRAHQEGARDKDVIENKINVTKKVLLDRLETLCENFVAIWTGRRKLHDELRKRYVQDGSIGRYARFQLPEVTWKYLDEMGYVEYLKVLCKAQESGAIEKLLDAAIPEGD